MLDGLCSTQKFLCHILSCDTLVANARYADCKNNHGMNNTHTHTHTHRHTRIYTTYTKIYSLHFCPSVTRIQAMANPLLGVKPKNLLTKSFVMKLHYVLRVITHYIIYYNRSYLTLPYCYHHYLTLHYYSLRHLTLPNYNYSYFTLSYLNHN